MKSSNESIGGFACLGWGSLIWEPGSLPVAQKWREDGPVLRLEFARRSNDDRITLVVCEQGTPCPTLWTTLSCSSLNEARQALAKREGLPSERHAAFCTSTETSGHHGAELVQAWAKKRGFAGVVWTGLPPKSPASNKNKDYPSIDDVISHLGKLEGDFARRAEEYVRKAPRQIATSYRARIVEELGWD